MDQVMRQRQIGIRTGRRRIKGDEEKEEEGSCFNQRQASEISKSRRNRNIIESHQGHKTTTVAPSNSSLSIIEHNSDRITKLKRRKWILEGEGKAHLVVGVVKPLRSNASPSNDRETKPKEIDGGKSLAEEDKSFKMVETIEEVSENYRVIQNRRQQIDCPVRSEKKEATLEDSERINSNNLDDNVERRKLDEKDRGKDDFLLKPSERNLSLSFDSNRLHEEQKVKKPSKSGGCLLKIGSSSAKTNRKRSGIGVAGVDKTASYLFLTLLIIIVRELYTQTRCNSTSNHLLNDQTLPASTTTPISQRCLSDLVLMRSCFAASTLAVVVAAAATATSDASATTRQANETLQPLNVTLEKAGVTMTEAQEQQTTTFSEPTLNLSLKNTTTDAVAAVATLVEGSSNNRTTIDSSNTTNHRHQIHQSQFSVLCNSRCNCVVLEPLFASKSANQIEAAAAAGKLPPAGIRMTPKEEKEGLEKALAATESAANNISASAMTTATGSYSSEQALIAFNEDYSLDYEQPVFPTDQPEVVVTATTVTTKTTATTTTSASTSTTMSGNESNDDDPAANIASTTLAGNDRVNAKNSTQMTGKLDAATITTTNSKSSSQSGSISASSTTNQTNNNIDLTSSVSSVLANFTKPEASNITSVSDVTGSSRQSQPLQTKQITSSNTNNSNLNKQTTSGQHEQGMTLFPLPSPHLHLHLHHHHHHGAGAGRDSSGPQLYAQSLYSSQAPKLSYHAHTPYLKTSPLSQTNNPGAPTNQNSFNTGDKILYQDSSMLNAFSLNPSSPSNPLTPGGGGSVSQNGPLQYHHMRSNYVAHHLRLQQQQQQHVSSPNSLNNGNNNLPINSNNFIASKTNNVFPQQFVLVPLKTMNMSQKLQFSLPSKRNNNNIHNNQDTSFNNNTNDTNDYYQDFESNWKEYPELIEKIELMLDDIDQNQIQSLNLSNNELQFELWSELYALLAIQMRQHLFHLDLSHNSLIKLGITFTGYIEHHIAAHNGWPIQQQKQLVNNDSNNNNQSDVAATTKSNHPTSKPSKLSKNSVARMRHSLFSGGKLYNLIRDKRQQQTNLLQLKNDKTNNINNNNLHFNNSILLQQALLIKALDLSHNKLKWLIKDQFRALKHVQTIRLDYNRIRYIHQHAFSGLESLRFLNLNFNRLQVIYIEQFQTNYNLLALMLRSNYLAYLRGGSFASLANLKRLDLSSNKLTIVSNNAFLGLESLELLNCSSNQFVHAPSASLHPLTSLRKFDLSDNLIAQLAPGTFFHLPIEELWLNRNEQLIAIDRGAFWDLPYLRKLHLRSNPMLMSVNSQAFVGTQNLQSIDVEDCQSLDDSARQMLDNITMTTTSRLLRYSEQQLQQQHPINNVEDINSTTKRVDNDLSNLSPEEVAATSTTSPKVLNDTDQSIQLADNNGTKQQTIVTTQNTSPRHSSHHINQQNLGPQSNRLRYIYYASVLTFLVAALKLVFKYTSTSHYMEARRRRRRVYETNSNKQCNTNSDCFTDTDDGNSMSSSNVDAFPMCVQPESHIFGLGNDISGVINNNNNGNNTNDDVDDNVGPEQVSDDVDQQCPSSDTGFVESGAARVASELEVDGQQQQQQVVDEHNEGSIDISVISNSVSSVIPIPELSPPTCCPDCPQQAQPQTVDDVGVMGETEESGRNNGQVVITSDQTQGQQLHSLAHDTQPGPDHSSFDLLHSQLVAAGYDYGHANCAHFYQSLGPALQLADITANFVNNMDYY